METRSRRVRSPGSMDSSPPVGGCDSPPAKTNTRRWPCIVGRHRRGVARSPVVPARQTSLPVGEVEADHTGPAGRADVDDQRDPFDERRRCGAEEILRHLVVGAQIALPHHLAGREVQAVELAFGAGGVDASACRSPDSSEVRCCSRIDPRRQWHTGTATCARPGFGVQALDDLLVADAMQDRRAVRHDGRRHVALALRRTPRRAAAAACA